MKQKYFIALGIAVAMSAWVYSGQFAPSLAEQTSVGENQLVPGVEVNAIPTVRGMVSKASLHTVELLVRGTTQVNRSVVVRSEISGRVVGLPLDKGSRANAGDVLCNISIDTRDRELAESRALQQQAALEYKGLMDLRKKGLQSEISLAQGKARLESANAGVARSMLAMSHTRVRAPFAGIIEEQPVEVGDFLAVGGPCATLIETDPILVVGQVAEKDIVHVTLGKTVTAKLITGETVSGKISYIAQLSDKATRAYRIEVEVPNKDLALRAGITSELSVPLETRMAHRISPAVLVLDDEGGIGVRVVGSDDKVAFYDVDIISEGNDGIWVSGLPQSTTVIVVGQEEVYEGQLVKADVTPLASLVSE